MIIEYIYTSDIKNKEIEQVEHFLPNRYLKAKKKGNMDLLSIGAGILLFKNFPNIKETDILKNNYGKLYIEGKDFFSISHSGKIAAFVKSSSEIGLDIELIDHSRIKTTKGLFTKQEQDYINKDNINNFFSLWTLKESLLKAVGQGINCRLDNVDVLGFINDGFVYYNNTKWYGANISFDGYSLSIVSKEPQDNIEIKKVLED